MFVEIALGVTQGPPVDSGQGGRLWAVDGEGPESRGFVETARSADTRLIGEELTFFGPTYPAVNRVGMRLGDHGNGARVDALHAQGDHEGAAFNFSLDKDATDGE